MIADRPPAQAPHDPPPVTDAALPAATIAVVDDCPTNLEVLSATLAEAGYEILVATDGETAIEQAQYGQPDLILLDVLLPGLDGFETCRCLKSNSKTREIPVIFTTALLGTTHKVRGFEAGGVDYIVKPFDRREVLARVRTHVKLRQYQQALVAQNRQLQAEIAERQRVERELQAANQQLGQLVVIDPLTRLANRRRFDAYLQESWARSRAAGQFLSLVLCDVDYFKPYNDTYGHLAGDRCLSRIARALDRAARRPTDLVARYGGEEFAVVLPNTDADGAVGVARAIQAQLQDSDLPHGRSPVSDRVTLSLGISTVVPEPGCQPEWLLDCADRALYRAKLRGRNCIAVIPFERAIASPPAPPPTVHQG